MDGQELIEAINNYIRGRANKYYAIMPAVERTGTEVDETQGTYFRYLLLQSESC